MLQTYKYKTWPCLGIILSSKLPAHTYRADHADNEADFVVDNG